jgi:hypothetical protein
VHFALNATGTSLLSASTMVNDRLDINLGDISCLFFDQFGMALGAYSWGSVADSAGRILPYHATILLTGLFNLGASYANSFKVLCFWMFAVGTAVGGSMPT